jgi:RimJ/RimL family protein N-acetyltransferase
MMARVDGELRRVAIVGVGLLGSAVASRLLAAGFDVTGYWGLLGSPRRRTATEARASRKVREESQERGGDSGDEPFRIDDGHACGRRARSRLGNRGRRGAGVRDGRPVVEGPILNTETYAATAWPAAGTAVADGIYPRELESVATLENGARVRIRPIRPDDAAGLQALFARLSFETVYHRFFSAMRTLPLAWATTLATVDYRRRLALVVEDDDQPSRLVAVARYAVVSEAPATAEIALVVDDLWQGLGLGSRLASILLGAAEARDIHIFRAEVLATNVRMLRLLRRHTLIIESHTRDGVSEIVFRRRPIEELTPASAEPAR